MSKELEVIELFVEEFAGLLSEDLQEEYYNESKDEKDNPFLDDFVVRDDIFFHVGIDIDDFEGRYTDNTLTVKRYRDGKIFIGTYQQWGSSNNEINITTHLTEVKGISNDNEKLKIDEGFIYRIIEDIEDKAELNEYLEPNFRIVEDTLDNGTFKIQDCVVVFERIIDGKFFRANYTMRFDGDIRSCDEFAVEVLRKEKTVYYYEQ